MPKVKVDKTGLITFGCPGCSCLHTISKAWSFNGDVDRPTFSPSILVRTGHYADGHKGDCWCAYNEKHPTKFKCTICHSFITDGKIQFLNDCTHELKGQTVDLIDLKEEDLC